MNVKRLFRLTHAKLREAAKKRTRSPRWSEVEKAHRKAHPVCAACGGTAHLQVHHIRPFHKYPELELEPTNLVTLCMAEGCEAHLVVGHGGYFRAWNVNVLADAAELHAAAMQRIAVLTRAKAQRHES